MLWICFTNRDVYAKLLEAERRRVHAETKSLQERMRLLHVAVEKESKEI